MGPLVTCLCLTRNRREWLPKAIACFRSQMYDSRELLIVADGEDVTDLVPVDPNIRLIRSAPGMSIGGKRNWGCERAKGELIAHFDDDDYSAPGRLTDQVERLQKSGRAVTGYHTMRFTDGARWWVYEGKPAVTLGTSLLYRRDWQWTHPFCDVQVGEDGVFVSGAEAAGQLIAVDAGGMMYATIHPGNTSLREPGEKHWRAL